MMYFLPNDEEINLLKKLSMFAWRLQARDVANLTVRGGGVNVLSCTTKKYKITYIIVLAFLNLALTLILSLTAACNSNNRQRLRQGRNPLAGPWRLTAAKQPGLETGGAGALVIVCPAVAHMQDGMRLDSDNPGSEAEDGGVGLGIAGFGGNDNNIEPVSELHCLEERTKSVVPIGNDSELHAPGAQLFQARQDIIVNTPS